MERPRESHYQGELGGNKCKRGLVEQVGGWMVVDPYRKHTLLGQKDHDQRVLLIFYMTHTLLHFFFLIFFFPSLSLSFSFSLIFFFDL